MICSRMDHEFAGAAEARTTMLIHARKREGQSSGRIRGLTADAIGELRLATRMRVQAGDGHQSGQACGQARCQARGQRFNRAGDVSRRASDEALAVWLMASGVAD